MLYKWTVVDVPEAAKKSWEKMPEPAGHSLANVGRFGFAAQVGAYGLAAADAVALTVDGAAATSATTAGTATAVRRRPSILLGLFHSLLLGCRPRATFYGHIVHPLIVSAKLCRPQQLQPRPQRRRALLQRAPRTAQHQQPQLRREELAREKRDWEPNWPLSDTEPLLRRQESH